MEIAYYIPMNYGKYTSHNQIPKTLVDYFETVAGNRIVDIPLEDINDFICMIEEYNVEETSSKKADSKKAA